MPNYLTPTSHDLFVPLFYKLFDNGVQCQETLLRDRELLRLSPMEPSELYLREPETCFVTDAIL